MTTGNPLLVLNGEAAHHVSKKGAARFPENTGKFHAMSSQDALMRIALRGLDRPGIGKMSSITEVQSITSKRTEALLI
jgi:hypothetical protein